MKHEATFFITTARSGTQWLAFTLHSVYADFARVEHEPIAYAYRPRLYLRAYGALQDLRSIPKVASHLAMIQSELERRIYIEVGFPCFAASPMFHEVFSGRIRLVQLVRHPVFAAASMVTHKWYQGIRPDHLEQHITLQPSDPGVYQKHYVDYWDSMSSYERCLFYWTEVHQFALEAHARFPDVPYHTVRFEDLVGSPKYYFSELVDFLGLPYRDELLEKVKTIVDSFHSKTFKLVRWRQIYNHPLTLALAQQFGYEMGGIDDWQFLRRYWHFLGWRWVPKAISRVRRKLAARVRS